MLTEVFVVLEDAKDNNKLDDVVVDVLFQKKRTEQVLKYFKVELKQSSKVQSL
jgi:hypothetical protein